MYITAATCMHLICDHEARAYQERAATARAARDTQGSPDIYVVDQNVIHRLPLPPTSKVEPRARDYRTAYRACMAERGWVYRSVPR